ncbi:hypothetical protein CROQUDRAFT_671176 [Cronartium quercuum f. sp. fusiforme G11]|uniref:Uncharacterized protein n=1 Tax=Cronartium quercuum f. sp. fusiforme G11 TaxID=708437 RepID=A0A9P6NMW9_9BASI|nr:hypothetical protein CROQUDRAFT_671176 [Cronartium quercuum f. sp. fusiforme G11]
MSPPSSNSTASRQRAASEPHLPSPKPLRAALKSAKRVFHVSQSPVSGYIEHNGMADNEASFRTTRLDHGIFADSTNRAPDRRPVLAFGSNTSRTNDHSRSQTLEDSLPSPDRGPKPVRPIRPTFEVDEDLIARPLPAISSMRLAGHLRKRAPSTALEPSPLPTDENTEDFKTPTPASCIQFNPRVPPPQFTPRFIFEEFERVYRAEDELIRARFAYESPKKSEPEPAPPLESDRERILRQDSLLSPVSTPNRNDRRQAGLGLAFPPRPPSAVFKPDDPHYQIESSPYLHQTFDQEDFTSPDRLESSSRMMKLFESYLENTPKSGNSRSSTDQDPSLGSSLGRLRSCHAIQDELIPRPAVISHELRTPAFAIRRKTTNVALVTTTKKIHDERSPDSDDGIGESPQTPSTGGVPVVRLGRVVEHESDLTPPRIILETQLGKSSVAREPSASWETTPPARPRTPETERQSPFKLVSLSNAAARLTHFREQTAPAHPKVRRTLDNNGWLHWPSVGTTRETRELVGRVLFEEEPRGLGFGSLKQLIGLRRGGTRNTAAPILAGPLLQDWNTPQSNLAIGTMAPPVLTLSPEDDKISPRRVYGKRQGVWETGHWTRGDLNLRPPEHTPEDVIDTVKSKQESKSRILRRAARASASAARSAATGLGIRA